VHDYLTQVGGAERVVKAWARGLRPDSISTLVWNTEGLPIPGSVPIFTTSLQRSSALVRDPRLALPFLPRYARSLHVPESSEVVLVSSSGFAHNVDTRVPKVIYWHSPARWLHAYDDYRLGLPLPIRAGLAVLRPYLMRTDRRGVAAAAVHLCNSHHVRRRLWAAYGVEARVVHPPVEALPGPAEQPRTPLPDRFFLTVGRQRGYKNTQMVLAAAEQAGVTVVSVGGAPEATATGPGCHIGLGAVTDAELKWLYGHAEALVSASREDFGLTPIEANLEGTPALVAGTGGFLDSVVPGVNGSFFAPESVDACAEALRSFRRSDFRPDVCRTHAEVNFSLDGHVQELRDALSIAVTGSPTRLPVNMDPVPRHRGLWAAAPLQDVRSRSWASLPFDPTEER
jgi:glycosyltransferase involved in cell wall biosynthesis